VRGGERGAPTSTRVLARDTLDQRVGPPLLRRRRSQHSAPPALHVTGINIKNGVGRRWRGNSAGGYPLEKPLVNVSPESAELSTKC